jgi:predicted DNA helicase
MEFLPYQITLLNALELELKEQNNKYNLDNNTSLKQLKSLGLVIQPITVVKKYFAYADYPEISFRLPNFTEISNFRENAAIECFIENEESVKGVLLSIDGNKGEFRLFAPDFPEWIEEKGVGIKLAADEHTIKSMKEAVKSILVNPELKALFEKVHGKETFSEICLPSNLVIEFKNNELNESQKNAIKKSLENEDISVLHGPPGTGKTSCLIETILQLIEKDEKIIVSAPSNTAVDNLAKALLKRKINILRLGNIGKVDEEILSVTPEGKLTDSKEAKDIKKLKIRAEELRKMAHQYKRNFGKEEMNQRNLLLKEVKTIRAEIRKIKNYFNGILFDKADVVLGTPIGLNDNLSKTNNYNTLIIDEAGQMLEPLAWLIFPFAKKKILAGDPLQLPPTVLSKEAGNLGLNISILEQIMRNSQNVHFLDKQYRMRKSIADFSSQYFYKNKLKSSQNRQNNENHILFYDTAGTGFEEEIGEDGFSLINSGELNLALKIMESLAIKQETCTFISPYSAQIELAKKILPKSIKIKTIDSFQGQENETIILSLVRSNQDANIGFLTDYRRMNVAITRAKEKLIIIGDSSTLAHDKFYSEFLSYIEKIEAYRSAWEFV